MRPLPARPTGRPPSCLLEGISPAYSGGKFGGWKPFANHLPVMVRWLLGDAEHTAARKGLSLGCGGPVYFWRRLPISKNGSQPLLTKLNQDAMVRANERIRHDH
jgi:hypothetical protein